MRGTVAGDVLRLGPPIGRMTTVGQFPTGGALTRDGRFYWAVGSGRVCTSRRVST